MYKIINLLLRRISGRWIQILREMPNLQNFSKKLKRRIEFSRPIGSEGRKRKLNFKKIMEKSQSLLESIKPIIYVEKLSSNVKPIQSNIDFNTPKRKSIRFTHKPVKLNETEQIMISTLRINKEGFLIWRQLTDYQNWLLFFRIFKYMKLTLE